MISRVLTFLLLMLPAAVAAQEQDRCAGLTISAVEITGCPPGSRCAQPVVGERLVSVTDLVGAVYAAERVDTAVRRLARSGYFAEVRAECSAISGTEAGILFTVRTNRYVRDVTIEGTESVYTSELEKRLFLRMGTLFDPERKESRERLERQTSTLKSYLRQLGYQRAEVTARATPVEPDLVDILLTVDEGRAARIEAISVDLQQAPVDPSNPQYSCPWVRKRDILEVLDVAAGDLVTAGTARAVKKKVRGFLQQYGFQSPRVKVEFDGKAKRLDVSVKVAQCFSIRILEREDEEPYGKGFKSLDEPALFAVLPFRESGVFDRREGERGLEELQIHYRLRGFLFARIEMQFTDYRELQNGWPYPLMGGVTYRVTRGQPSEIREIRFEGESSLTEDDLLEMMQTKRYDFFDVGGFLDVDQLFADLDVIRQEYFDLGHFRMRYVNAEKGGETLRVQHSRRNETSIYRYVYADKAFDVEKPDWENAIRIVVRIDEGPGAEVGHVAGAGTSAIGEERVIEASGLGPGAPFSPQQVKVAVIAIEDFYRHEGYRPKVTVRCSGHEPEVQQEECTPEAVRSGVVDLVFQIEEGARYKMGEVLVVGNLKTKWDVVAEDFPARGDYFDGSRIDEALRKLRNLGVFATVKTVFIGDDETPPRHEVAVVVQVEETATRFVELSAGFQTMARPSENKQEMDPRAENILSNSLYNTGSSLSGSASFHTIRFPDVLLLTGFTYTNTNLAGYAKTFEWPLSYGLSTTDPARYAAFKPTYIDRRFFATELTFRVTPLIVYDKAMDMLDKVEYGVENELARPLTEGVYLGLISKVSRIAWKEPGDPLFHDFEFQFESSPVIRFDWRDNPINPMSGTLVWGRLSYINALSRSTADTESGTRDNFWKFEMGTQLYLSFRQALVLAANLRYGDSVSVGGANLPEYQRYRLGGTNGVRGILAGRVFQYNADGSLETEAVPLSDKDKCKKPGTGSEGSGGDLAPGTRLAPVLGGDTVAAGSLELRFPIMRASGLWGATFLDSGGLSDGLADMHGNSIRFTTGAGIRWLIGGTIPLRLDYGFVLDRRCGEVDCLGKCTKKEDPGAMDFGLLYTF